MVALSIGWLFEINSSLTMRQVELAGVAFAIRLLVTWSWWRGRNWARVLVALYSGFALVRLFQWNHVHMLTRQLWLAEAALAIFLLAYMPRAEVTAWFTRKRGKAAEQEAAAEPASSVAEPV